MAPRSDRWTNCELTIVWPSFEEDEDLRAVDRLLDVAPRDAIGIIRWVQVEDGEPVEG